MGKGHNAVFSVENKLMLCKKRSLPSSGWKNKQSKKPGNKLHSVIQHKTEPVFITTAVRLSNPA
jgi:hypothetical protein